MTLADLHRDEALRQREFPVARDKVYLAHAGVCPLPRRVSEAIAAVAAAGGVDDQETGLADLLARTRQSACQLLGADSGTVALLGPTTAGLATVANGLDWRAGDNVVIYFDDYPSNVYPWMALASRGVEVRGLRATALGQITPEQVLEKVDARTRLVALASCHFISGWRLDVNAIGRALRERGVLFCVDAIQTLGAFPASVEHVDFLAADSHKWLLGPCSAGVFYARRELQDQLRPTVLGWNNVRCPDYVAQPELSLRHDARRYEPASYNILGIAGLRAALDLILEIGVENIAAELLLQRVWFTAALQAKGYVVLHADAPMANSSGIVSFHKPGGDMMVLHAKLAAAGVVASLRTDRAGQRYLRFSPHFYNTAAELGRALDCI